MRRFYLPVAVLLAAAGCRETRDADSSELSQIEGMSNGMRTTNSVATDMGQASFGNIFTYYAYIQSLSQEQESQPAGLGGLPIRSGAFVSRARTAWPDCVTSTDSSYTYDQCEYAYAGSGSVSFILDGSLNFAETSADGELSFDLAVAAEDISVEVGFDWIYDFAWSDTTLEGSFEMDYATGVAIGSMPSLGGSSFDATGTIDPPLTWDAACTSGPVSGVIDWRSTLHEGTNPPETEHVTLEYLACGQVTITI